MFGRVVPPYLIKRSVRRQPARVDPAVTNANKLIR
jgi:hypothetical protein